ncbi:MAG: hypothetical protein K2I70_03360, partial [Bacilli bacterium]|nr:hypothetical protein [Bacilli bacterium]
LFRDAVNNYYKFKNREVEGQITTRDLKDIKTEIEDGILSDEKILCYEFIETKEPSCLAHIISYTQQNNKNLSSKAKSLAKKFERAAYEMHPEMKENG